MRATTKFKGLWHDERGTAAVEMGLLLGLIVIGIFGAVTGLGQEVKTSYDTTSSKVQVATTAAAS